MKAGFHTAARTSRAFLHFGIRPSQRPPLPGSELAQHLPEDKADPHHPVLPSGERVGLPGPQGQAGCGSGRFRWRTGDLPARPVTTSTSGTGSGHLTEARAAPHASCLGDTWGESAWHCLRGAGSELSVGLWARARGFSGRCIRKARRLKGSIPSPPKPRLPPVPGPREALPCTGSQGPGPTRWNLPEHFENPVN